MTEPAKTAAGPAKTRKVFDNHAAAIKELQGDVKRLKATALELENIIVVIDGNLLTAEIPMRRGALVV